MAVGGPQLVISKQYFAAAGPTQPRFENAMNAADTAWRRPPRPPRPRFLAPSILPALTIFLTAILQISASNLLHEHENRNSNLYCNKTLVSTPRSAPYAQRPPSATTAHTLSGSGQLLFPCTTDPDTLELFVSLPAIQDNLRELAPGAVVTSMDDVMDPGRTNSISFYYGRPYCAPQAQCPDS